MTTALRFIAIAIAAAGSVDPAFTSSGRVRARVAVVVQDGPTMALPTPDGSSRRALAERVRAQLEDHLGSAYDIQPTLMSDAAAAIVIGDRYPEALMTGRPGSAIGQTSTAGVPTELPVSTVTVASGVAPNVRIVSVDAPREVPVATAIRVTVDVEGVGVAGQSTKVTVHSAGLEVGDASHEWKGDRGRWRAQIDAAPVGEPPFVLRVEAQPLDIERTQLDNVVDTIVDARRTPFRIQVHEPRPSWATTFVRRALEADARFHVTGVTSTSRSTATRTADAAALTDAALESVDVLVVGGLEKLTAPEARTLERFMRDRGGAVVVVPDARVTAGAARDLIGATLTERLSDRPEKLIVAPPLEAIQASELLLMSGDGPVASELIAWTSGKDSAAVAVSSPRGQGRLFFSGALDAWRFRARDGGAFDRYWQSTIAGLALAVRPPIAIAIEPPILRPDEAGEVVVRVRNPPIDREVDGPAGAGRGRTMRAAGDARPVRAEIDGQPIRLWPEPEPGVFRGSFVAGGTGGRSSVVARVDGVKPASASRALAIRGDAQHALPQAAPPLSMLAASHHGIDVTPDNVAAVERFIRGIAAPQAARTRHPMRSAWWILPFAACLSAEWWLRRRKGVR
jgi:hypothetical protein